MRRNVSKCSLAIGALVLLLSACGKQKEEAKGNPVVESYFSAVAEQEKVGSPYHVRLKWTTSDKPLLWILDRFERRSGRRDSIVVDGASREYIDRIVVAGEFYTYYLVAQAPYKYGLKTQVLIPDGEDN